MIINCKMLSNEIREKALAKLKSYKDNPYYMEKHLAIVFLNYDEESTGNHSYVKSVQRTFNEAGIKTKVYKTDWHDVSVVTTLLREMRVPTLVVAKDPIDKAMVEAMLDYNYLLDSADFGKFPYPCVVDAADRVLTHMGFSKGIVTVLGRGSNVGKPMVDMLMNNYTATTVLSCNSRTPNPKYFTLQSDVVISCVGKPDVLTLDMVKPNAIVIDIGCNSANGKMVGDCNSELLSTRCDVTPVPSGMGIITRAILLERFVEVVAPPKLR